MLQLLAEDRKSRFWGHEVRQFMTVVYENSKLETEI